MLQRYVSGEPGAAEALLPILYDELHRLAVVQMKSESRMATLSPTVLVHEAYVSLLQYPPSHLENRAHFCSLAARAMRRVLVDYVRGKLAAKRGGGGLAVTLEEGSLPAVERSEDILRLDRALEKLQGIDPELLDHVELRFFAGLTQEEIAELRGLSIRTVKRRWSAARAWLARELESQV
ncbi:MAG: sigma-70 family RNA polymerase sigma factor [Candidatus Eisenbacteria bacterium]|uniref:Sigma-70 family RNA polymerase sigma factor n=1 Tax=Eiseniibacteriota bacterium TaxID=2212470 RepID=A0A956NKV4_UNCEI|nr:sigma-70 family RNA polymerase sigma factor [Candidatus Eisenbacteria bacterium]